MTNKNLSILLCLFLAACGSGESTNDGPAPGTHRAALLSDLGLTEPLDPEQTSIVVRQYVHSNNIAPPGWPLEDPAREVGTMDDVTEGDYWPQYLEWKAGIKRYKCGGLVHLYAWMMEELGIPSRRVSLVTEEYFQPNGYPWSHETAEAYLNGKWVVRDPTYNAAFQCAGGADASIAELRNCRNSIVWTYGVFNKPEQVLEVYPKPFVDHLFAVHYFQSRLIPEPILENWWN